MKEGLDISLLESQDTIKRSLAFIANNLSRLVALITFIFAGLVIFTDVQIGDISQKSFGALLLLLTIASYVIYFSMEDAGEKLGEQSDEYKKAREEYLQRLSKIRGEDVATLRVFLKRYSENELEYRREGLLFSNGFSRKEYDSYLNGENFNRRARQVFKRVKAQRAVALTPATLLRKERLHIKNELKSPESTKILVMILKLIPSTLCMAVTVSVVLSFKESLNVISVLDGLLKLSSLPIIGFKGYAQGYNYVRKSLSGWLDTKSGLIDAFLREKGSIG